MISCNSANSWMIGRWFRVTKHSEHVIDPLLRSTGGEWSKGRDVCCFSLAIAPLLVPVVWMPKSTQLQGNAWCVYMTCCTSGSLDIVGFYHLSVQGILLYPQCQVCAWWPRPGIAKEDCAEYCEMISNLRSCIGRVIVSSVHGKNSLQVDGVPWIESVLLSLMSFSLHGQRDQLVLEGTSNLKLPPPCYLLWFSGWLCDCICNWAVLSNWACQMTH